MRRPRPLPVELQDAPFTVADAREKGVSRSRLRWANLEAPFRGIRDWLVPVSEAPQQPESDGQPADGSEIEIRATEPREATDAGAAPDKPKAPALKPWELARRKTLKRARAYAVKMPAAAFFSHVTAAHIHGLPLPRAFDDQPGVDVGTTVRGQRRRGAKVRGHLMRPADVSVRVRDALRVASPIDVWCQLALELTVDQLVVMGDALVRRQSPIAAIAQLEAAVSARAGRRGVNKLREALDLVRPRTDSVKETELRLAIVHDGLPEPEVNVAVYDSERAFIGMFDMVYREFRILLEYDGVQHREDEAQFLLDVNRLDAAMEEGWRVIRANKEHAAAQFAETLRRVRAALLARGWRP
ncbi:MAG TPA: hypothetical protein VIJ18_01910 [Microbacteriaceae bacterium]